MRHIYKCILICVILCAIVHVLYFFRICQTKYENKQPQTFCVSFGVGKSNLVSVQVDEKILMCANVTQPNIDIFSDIPDKFRYYSQLSFTICPNSEEIAQDSFVYILDYKTKKGVKISLRDLSCGNYGMVYVSFGEEAKNQIYTGVSFENKSMIWFNDGDSNEDFPVRIFSVAP